MESEAKRMSKSPMEIPGHGVAGATGSPFRQPKAVWAVAFACVVSFMGIGLVDPILPALSTQLNATPSNVELLFTSYLVVTAVAMLVTGWVSSRIGGKRTLLAGLVLIVAFSALAGSSHSISEIIDFRAGWGLGNALFIATSLAVIVGAASGGFGGAIILYETALGVGIALGPLVGGLLGGISWRGPFFGVTVLMAISLMATLVFLDQTPKPTRKIGLTEPLRALRHRGLATISVVALFYNWAFFTVLAYSPFPMHLGIHSLGFVFTGWGVLVALFAVLAAPRLQARFGTARTQYVNFFLMAVDLLVIAVWTDHKAVLIVAVIVSGAFIGLSNTLMTQAVMQVSPVDRSVASAAYGFVRFIGGGLAPYAAGKLAAHYNAHVPFYVGAALLIVAIGVLATGHELIAAADGAGTAEGAPGRADDDVEAAEETGEMISVGLGE
jgi:MFS family permease